MMRSAMALLGAVRQRAEEVEVAEQREAWRRRRPPWSSTVTLRRGGRGRLFDGMEEVGERQQDEDGEEEEKGGGRELQRESHVV